MKSLIIKTLARSYISLRKRPRLTVATFHRLGDQEHVTPRHIRHHLKFMATHYKITTPSEYLKHQPTEPAGMITIDDCHADIYQHFFPIAKAMGIPFVIAVPTDYFLRKKWLWFDRFYCAMYQTPVDFILELEGRKYALRQSSDLAKLKKFFKSQLPAQRDSYINQAIEQIGVHVPDEPTAYYRAVNDQEMKEMLASGLVELCTHTVTHPITSLLDPQTLDREIAQPKQELEDYTGIEIPAFCYPNGGIDDFSDRTTESVIKAGYKMAFTSVPGINDLRNPDMMHLLRVHAHSKPYVFEKLASGLQFLA